MKKKPVFLMLGAGVLQIPMINAAKDLGYTTLVLDQNEKAKGKELADIFLPVQFAYEDRLFPALEEFKNNIRLAATCGTDFSHVIASINSRLSLPGIKPKQARIMTHKGHMRDHLEKFKILQPPYICTTSKEQAENWAKAHQSVNGFVIKPAQNMGARGVMRMQDYTDLCYAYEFAVSHDSHETVVLEEYIPAQEISVDALVFQGKVFLTGLADRLIEVKDNLYFIENGHTMPSGTDLALKNEIRLLLQKFADSLRDTGEGDYHGALKADLRITQDKKILVGEIAGRLSGGYMSTHTFPRASGKNLMHAFIKLLQGEKVFWLGLPEHEMYDKVCIERSIYANPGQLSGLADISRWNDDPQKIEVFCNYENNDMVRDLQNNVGKVYHTVITSMTLTSAEQEWEKIKNNLTLKTSVPQISRKEIERISRKKFNNNYCWVCQICDGDRCASGIPGMGGRGEMNGFRDNIKSLTEYKIIPKYIETTANIQPKIEISLFGKAFSGPLLSAPITGSLTNMGGSITEWDYAYETASAFQHAGLLPCFGDGATHDKYLIGLKVIARLGTGLPVFKPRSNQNELISRIRQAEEVGALAWGMDIDGVSFRTMQLKSQATEHKSMAQIKELQKSSKLPFFLKGIMTIDDAKAACELGASAVIVSNHGGRVLDDLPGTARVLPEIADFIKSKYPHVTILADGGIRSGTDIFKMLALGAEAVLVGRPIVIAAVGLGRSGVSRLLQLYLEEFKQAMQVLGLNSLKDISRNHVRHFSVDHSK